MTHSKKGPPMPTTSNPVIPAPAYQGIVQGAKHQLLMVRSGDFDVVYCYREGRVSLSLVDKAEHLNSTHLDRVIREQSTVGREVVSAGLDCGGVLGDLPKFLGTAEEIAVVMDGIEQLYPAIQDTEERAAVRAIYRYLVKRQAA